MIIPLDKLLAYNGNKYVFSKASMKAVEKIANIKHYPEDDISWKVVPNILKLTLNETIHYVYHDQAEEGE
ncbi:MAG TPA: hypothetical protein PK926_08890 [Spirochaetota bacterium]|nr:hypothetical protein [Spirochaetota bacterium]HPI88594.1 hypothetical protein [Spirochaetota bacterium]HPR48235.1 hypothetical protein [Spirochaetota bacterium]